MKIDVYRRRALPLFAAVSIVLAGGCRRPAVPVKKGDPRPAEGKPSADAEATGGIDAKIVAAWEKAGAKFGWEAPVYEGLTGKTPFQFKFVDKCPDKAPFLPAFSAAGKRLPGLADLPAPQTPFGLDLPRSNRPAAELRALARFTQMQSLRLTSADIGDSGLKELRGLTQLECLMLGGNRLTDAGLKELAGLTNLKMLFIGANDIHDAALKELKGLAKLESLGLHGMDIGNAACKDLAGMKQLRMLDMHLTKIGDAGLRELARLKDLEFLFVAVTDVTDAGLAEFRKALPNCEVRR